ncbi:MAG TPA: metallophosphoesterase family protein [Candidatus Omnitrophota bacterium]|nr:metallophosphoesterase family protein [Candidatus Omnitrophota bacterium]
MRIGVISDTHSRPIPTSAVADLKKMDFIIHAGDICCEESLRQLQKINEIKAVHGNMDDGKLRGQLARTQLIRCGAFTIGVFHGEGHPDRLLACVQKEFKDQKVDAVVFGHSHHPFNEKIGSVLFFNPGSITDTVFAPYRSYGILDITDKITATIVRIDEQ